MNFQTLSAMLLFFVHEITTTAVAQPVAATLPMTRSANGHVIVLLYLNQQGPFRFLVDTGCDRIVLDQRIAERLNLQSNGETDLAGAGNATQRAQTAEPLRLTTQRDSSSAGFEHPQPLVIPLARSLGARGKLGFDGIIGRPLFAENIVIFDWEDSQVRLQASFDSSDAKVIPMTIRRGYPFVQCALDLGSPNSHKTVAGNLMIDTGSFHGVVLDFETSQSNSLLRPESQKTVVAGNGIGGKIAGLATMSIGSLQLGDCEVTGATQALLRTKKGGRPPVKGRIGNLGLGILDQFTIVFDDVNRQLLLIDKSRDKSNKKSE